MAECSGGDIDFNYYVVGSHDFLSSHPKIQPYRDVYHAALVSYATSSEEPEQEDALRWDCWNWESSVALQYEVVEFWYENGRYFHILEKVPRKKWITEDFHILQEEILGSSPFYPILEVNILLFQ